MRSVTCALVLIALAPVAAAAQDKPPAQPADKPAVAAQPAPRGPSSRVPLKVTFVLSRYHGDKKTSSLPYTLGVTANGSKTTLRMGVEVPVSTTVFQGPEGTKPPVKNYNYRSVGTNIDCQAFWNPDVAPGTYELVVTIADSSVSLDAASKPSGTSAIVDDVPSFRSFHTSFAVLLRDGQTSQHTSATDPVSGEVMKVDVTLDVSK